jgi:hypothetical protein
VHVGAVYGMLQRCIHSRPLNTSACVTNAVKVSVKFVAVLDDDVIITRGHV